MAERGIRATAPQMPNEGSDLTYLGIGIGVPGDVAQSTPVCMRRSLSSGWMRMPKPEARRTSPRTGRRMGAQQQLGCNLHVL
jgi:hypothetical protein